MLQIIKKNKVFLTIALLIIIVGLLLVNKFLLDWHKAEAYEFNGKIEKVDGNLVYLDGNYSDPAHPEWSGEGYKTKTRVNINSSTSLIKVVLYRSSNIDLSNPINPKDLRREVVVGSIDDLASGKVMEASVRSDKNIYGKNKFSALNITYYWVVDSK